MKYLWLDLNQIIKHHFSTPALFWVGVALTMVFALVGAVVSIRVWLPIVTVITVISVLIRIGRYRINTISPEREALIRQTVSYIVSMSIRKRMPYKFDLPTKEMLAKRLTITKSQGAEIVTVPLLIMENGEIDLQLLDKVISDHLETIVDMSPGLGLKAYSDVYNVLTLIKLNRSKNDIFLHIVVADNWFANKYLDQWFQTQMQSKQGDGYYE